MNTVTQGIPKFVLGVDGGQSGTQTVLATTKGQILAAATTGPMTHVQAMGGVEQVSQALREGYEHVLTAAHVERSEIGCIHLGLSGVNDLEFVKALYRTDLITESGDAHIALMGAFPVDCVGILVTAGTGSHAYGRRADGKTVFSGGRGYYLGDEGGGTDIAQQAFRAVYQAADGRGEKTDLHALILEHFQCPDLDQLLINVYAQKYNRHQLAQVSKLVGQAAAGDDVAVRILANAGHELGKAVVAVLTSLEQVQTPFPIAPNGSVFKTGRLVTDSMMTTVHRTHPQAYLTAARFPPAIGAVLQALRDLEISIDDQIFRNIEASKGIVLQKETANPARG
jgi:N-acetylglucosamine kinase-like BadF-type ATPase